MLDSAIPDAAIPNPAIREFLAADSRTRRALLQALRPTLSSADAAHLAPALRDSSPKIAARVTAVLARFGLREAFEAQLVGLKPGKVSILRRHFDRIEGTDRPDSTTLADDADDE